ncbi:hypothetical protein [Planomicrobium sp. CPCC 101110]|uniref:hypothetical protein n=1 Tax=Planomicrobium sp. CPCC 101110 TaxID=2599619 RepID=UPI0011B7DD6C|nr:hypothetical protein [Planomicrobium sp. CPCC 101110]TWT27847.1 hypothetical protein FQV30_04890 [Planomicrobium sp. CPCC 101110]
MSNEKYNVHLQTFLNPSPDTVVLKDVESRFFYRLLLRKLNNIYIFLNRQTKVKCKRNAKHSWNAGVDGCFQGSFKEHKGGELWLS